MEIDPNKLTVDSVLAGAVSAFPDREAVVCGTARVTYRELGERVNALAVGLHKLGLKRSERVAVLLPNSLEFVYAYFGIARAGGVLVATNPLYRRREIGHILSDSEASVVIFAPNVWGNDLLGTLQDLRKELPCLRHLLAAGSSAPEGVIPLDSLLASGGSQELPSQSTLDDLFGLMYTSGTTGLPKAVMHTHRSMLAGYLLLLQPTAEMLNSPILAAMEKMRSALGGRQPVTLDPNPLYATAGYATMQGTLQGGDKFVTLDRFTPAQTLEMTQREKINILFCTPSMYRLMLEAKDFDKYDKSSLFYCSVSTAPCPPALFEQIRERFGCPVINVYGTTEFSGITITNPSDPDRLQTQTVGRGMPGAQIKIVDEQRHELPPGEMGELACKWAGLMKGYYKAPELTAEVLDEEGWYYTGDLAVMDDQGYYKIVGRKKDMIIRGGQNIFPLEIENFLLTHPGIKQVAVVGVPSELEGETVWAFVVLKEGEHLTPKDVLGFCRGQIAPFKVPSVVRIVNELPVTGTQKVQKFKLREIAVQELEQGRRGALH